MACSGNSVGCVAGEAGASAKAGGADERPDVGSNRAAAASAGESVLVSGVLTVGEGACCLSGESYSSLRRKVIGDAT